MVCNFQNYPTKFLEETVKEYSMGIYMYFVEE